MQRRLIILIFFTICYFLGFGQNLGISDCDFSNNFASHVAAAQEGDNYVEINFSDVSVKKEADGYFYLYFTINLKALGTWYTESGSKVSARNKYLGALDIYLDFNQEVFGNVVAEISPIECLDYNYNEDDDLTWRDAYVSGNETVIAKPLPNLIIGVLGYSDTGDGGSFALSTSEYLYVGKFRWRLKAGVTGGKTGVKLRIPTISGYEGDGTYPSKAYDYKTQVPFGICQTGPSLDIEFGEGGAVPVINSITGDLAACEGASATYTADVEDGVTLNWVVKQGAMNVTSTVVDGTMTPNGKSVSFKWKDHTAGTYSICATATKGGKTSDEKCESVTVNAAPALAVTSTPDVSGGVCTGDNITLNATAGLTNYKWYLNGTLINGATTRSYTPTLPVVSSVTSVTYKVEAQSATACPASGELNLSIHPQPLADATVKVGNSSVASTDNRYYLGDNINLTAKNVDASKYDYSWENASGTTLATGPTYNIYGATEANYRLVLKVRSKTSPYCTATKEVNLTQNTSCVPALALSGSDNNRICLPNGICRLTAELTNACSTTVTDYVWYRNGVKLDSIVVSKGEKKNIFNAVEDGNYTVKVYTYRGMLTKSVTISRRNQAAATITMPDTYLVTSGGSTLLTPNPSAPISSWSWESEPAGMIATGATSQYPTTASLSAPVKFYVYAQDQYTCWLMDSTWVRISNDALNVKIKPENPIVCQGGSVTLKAEVSGGDGAYTYSWSSDEYGSSTSASCFFQDDALFATGSTRLVNKILTVTDGAGHTGVAKTVVQIVTTPNPNLGISGGGAVCEGNVLTVTGGNAAALTGGYVWYIRDNTTGAIYTRMASAAKDTIKLGTRGDYYVWVSGKTAACASDTTGKGVAVKVNGFDLAFTTHPSNYKLGATIEAGVTASNGAQPYTFNWTSPAEGVALSGNTINPNNFKLVGASAPEYTFRVTATDANGCSKTIEEKVENTISGGLKVTVPDEVNLCRQGAPVMTATVTGGTPSYKFEWYQAGNESSILYTKQGGPAETTNTYIASGSYTTDTKMVVRVTDATGLISRDTVLIKVRNDLTAPQIDAGDPMTIAYNTQTYLLGTVISGNPTSGTWADAAMLASGKNTANPYTVALTSETTYTAYATDANQCTSAADQVTVRVTDDHNYKLAVKIDPIALLCRGSEVTMNAVVTPQDRAISAWKWGTSLAAADGSFDAVTNKNPLFTITNVTASSADIIVKVTDNANVAATDKITVTLQNAMAPVLQITGFNTSSGTNNICSLEDLRVSSTNGVTLGTCTWYVGGVEKQKGNSVTYKPSASADEFQNIKVSALSSAGCPATGATEVGIIVHPKPVLAWRDAGMAQAAPGDVVKVTAYLDPVTSGQYTYTWNHAGTSSSVHFTDEGTTAGNLTEVSSTADGTADVATQPYYFKVKVRDGNGCESLEIDSIITVDGAALSVKLEALNGGFCQGGAAILQAEVTGVANSNVNFEWYKGTTRISGATGPELVVANPNTTDQYKVKVSLKSDATRTGESSFVTLTQKSGIAPDIAGVDMRIPTGTKTALVANTTADIQSWKWYPENKLASGENTLPSPYTTLLSAQTIYTVCGVDGNGCIGVDDDVQVNMMNGLNPGTFDPELFVKVIPPRDTICEGNELDLRAEVWSSIGGTPTYSWKPSTHLGADVSSASVKFGPVSTSGDYSYTVLVNVNGMVAAGRADIVVVPGVIPNLVVDAGSGAHCAGNDLVLTANNIGSSVNLTYTWTVNGTVQPVTGNTYTWPATGLTANYHVKVTAKSTDHCISTTYEDDFTIDPAVELQKLQVIDSCGQVILVADAGAGAAYSWTIKSGSVQASANNDTCRVVYQGILNAASASYTVNVEATPQNGGCKATKDVTGKIYFKPRAEFAAWTPDGETTGLPYMMVEKNDNVTLSLNQANWNLTSAMAAVNIDWTAEHTSSLTPSANQTSCTVNSIQQDDSVYIRIANKEAETCMVSDTMPLYLYPEAPSIRIDTVDGSLVNAALYLDGADKYTIWSRKWDPYCLTSEITGDQVYKNEGTISTNIWKEADMDTLEFYYATSVKNIQGRDWQSKITSDTVGYYKQDIKMVHDDGGNAVGGLNYVPYIFDMTSVLGENKTKNFIEKIIGNITGSQLSYFVHEEQVWNTCYYQPEVSLPNGVILKPAEWKFDDTMHVGLSYLVQIEPDQTIMQYGKLSARISYVLKNYSKGALNPGYLAGHHADIERTGDIVTEIRTDDNGLQVGYWVLNEQNFTMTYYQPALTLPNGTVLKPAEMKSSKKIRPYTPLIYSVDKDDVFK